MFEPLMPLSIMGKMYYVKYKVYDSIDAAKLGYKYMLKIENTTSTGNDFRRVFNALYSDFLDSLGLVSVGFRMNKQIKRACLELNGCISSDFYREYQLCYFDKKEWEIKGVHSLVKCRNMIA